MKYIIKPMESNNINVDIFLYLTYINKLDENIKVKFKMIPSKFNKNNLLNILKPKKYKIIEYTNKLQEEEMNINNINYMNYWTKEKNINYAFSAFGMYAKIFKCNELKKQYEQENNFKYDFVWRGRLDYIFMDYITLDIINFNKQNLYLIKDRYAYNTNKETNDKFFGCSSELMDNICNIYYELPNYIKLFEKNKMLLEGQNIIQTKIKDLKNNNIITKCFMISHRNAYCKCQCRHQIKISKKRVFINLTNLKLLKELAYLLLYEGYQVYSYYDDYILNLFEHYKKLDKGSRRFEYVIIDNKIEDNNSAKKKLFIIIDNIDKIDNSIKNIKQIQDQVLIFRKENPELELDFNLNRNKKIIYIHYLEHINISNILFGFVNNNIKYKVYKITKEIYHPELNDMVHYYIPDRGRFRDLIKHIKIKNGKYYYKIGDRTKWWYFINEIRILNWDNYIDEKYII